ncbi:hypothetical protein P3L10_023873 [Capsicum annuum]|uniref:uncharacterized protein LOC107879368 n=1 Tax=Capsicum annuum TaxID=4072 RepID=UPI0007BF6ACE|nr:uncharacterized protein LOC107879368 [Capsicum annuum]
MDHNRFCAIPLQNRTTLRSSSSSMNMSTTTLLRRLKSEHVRRHSNATKPYLKEENKISRLQFCMSMLDRGSISHDPIFINMFNIVHIDEKWFYMTKKNEIYYLLSGEEDPIRTVKSKNFIDKVMFLVVVARPRFAAQGVEIFSDKIGLFPFVTQERAKRASANRPAGTVETKAMTSITKEISRSFLINEVLPAIKAKWSREDLNSTIFIQQDNARTHI